MKRLLALALASLLCAAPATVLGLGLGEIRLHSALNQALDAEIELLDVSADELDGLVVRLAAAELFDRYGIDRPPLLAELTFEVARRSDGSAFVRIKSVQPLREPFLTLLVEARWGRGRLLREYTMLVDPPAFMAEERPVVPAPAVAEPTYAPTVQPESFDSTPVPAPVTPPRQPESQPEYSAPEPVSPQVATPATPSYQPETVMPSGDTAGGDYGPVKRNETLWGIASRLKPGDAVTVNQMMLAIFRANPDAFRGNINRLNSGAILRIPDLETVRALSAREAFVEAKRQNDEWRPSFASTPLPAPSEPYVEPAREPVREPVRTPEPAPVTPVAPAPVTPVAPEPSLTVTAPSEDEAPVSDPGARVAQLERELEAAKASKGKKGRERVARLERELEEAKRLIQVPSQTLSEIQDQAAATPSQAETPSLAETPAPTETTPTEPAPEPEVVQRAPRKPSKGLFDTVLDNLANPLVLGGLVLLLLIPFALVGAKRLKPRLAALAAARKARAEAAAAAKAAAQAEAASSWTETDADDDDKTVAATPGGSEEKTVMDFGEFSEPAKPAAPAAGGFAGLFGGGGDGRTGETMVEPDVQSAIENAASDKTQVMPRPSGDMEKTVMQTVSAPMQPSAPASAPAAKPSHEDTVIGGTPMKLDENDPLSEADFHMAYGLYDQAADLLKKASQRDPSRRDIKLKLLETYFASGNKGAFVEAARALRAEMGARPDADWNSVLIFGKQMAPEESLFSEQASAGAADLDFGAAGTGTETAIDLAFDAPMEAAPAAAPADPMLDFDITGAGAAPAAPAAPEPAAAPADDAGGLEFDLGDFKLDTESVTQAPAAKAAPKVGSGEVKDTDTQSDFDKALAELSAFVDTNLPAEEAGGTEGGGEFNLDSLDLGDDAALGDIELDGGGDDGNEIDTKLDLARAYIDMGDPDGARNILEEVVSDGTAQQKADAQKLLAQIK